MRIFVLISLCVHTKACKDLYVFLMLSQTKAFRKRKEGRILSKRKLTKENIETIIALALVIAIMAGAIFLIKSHQKQINIIDAENERKQQLQEKQKERNLIEKSMPTGAITCSKDGEVFLQLSSEDNLNVSFRITKKGVLIIDYFDHGTPKHLEEKGATCVSSFVKPQTP
ncbi:MAG: hypothetical protein Q4A35_04150 [Candidatus Gracilibacteria bacterium]|nr:hypothetical protein [Candidatus Gracilibacteria bacterium]